MALPIGNASAQTCDGMCGTSPSPDGVVITPPTGGSYRWISTYGSTNTTSNVMPGVPILDGSAGATNGTLYTTSPFTVNGGASLNYYFNYITSDGQTVGGTYVYQDYAWAQLRDTANNIIATLLTARTEPTGSIIPGSGMPSISAGVTLTPSSVPIINAGYDPTLNLGPVWSPLGDPNNSLLPGSSGTCYGPGCGYTGWVNSTYTIQNAGTYVLLFGVTNWADIYWDSGLAFSGLTIDGTPIGGEDDIAAVPVPAALPLFATGLGALGLLGWRRKKKAQANAA